MAGSVLCAVLGCIHEPVMGASHARRAPAVNDAPAGGWVVDICQPSVVS